MATRNTRARHQHKRHGRHQKQTHHFLKVYAPYLPLLCTLGVIIFSNGPLAALRFRNHGVLAYSTSMSISDLLSATNTQRAQNGQAALKLNSELNQAAQAKANDMVARNYWSHVTPDGKQPWYFFDQAGYVYQKAGENLAYGFATSSDTITGWMNSPSHRENLLDSAFIDVGFGFANNPNYQNSGPETIVVAEYGEPQVKSAQTTAPAPTKPAATQPTTPTPTPTPAAAPAPSVLQTTKAASHTTASLAEPTPAKISRIQALTRGLAPWSNFAVGLVVGAAALWLVIKHGLGLRRLFVDGERFILHHPLLDTTLVSLIILGIFLSQTAGVIR